VCSWGRSALLLAGATGDVFNWGDAHAEAVRSAPLFAAAAACGQPALAAAARLLAQNTVEDLVWWDDSGTEADLAALPLAAVYADPSADAARGRKTHVGAFRSAWAWTPPANRSTKAPTALLFKGGENHFDDHQSNSHNNHGHHDVGSFVFDAQGVRWAVDLGPDAYDYPLLAYFGRFRFGYHFLSSAGHNVLSFDADTQHRRGSGGIVAAAVAPSAPPWAAVDVTAAYGGATRVTRTFALGAAADAACVPATVSDAWAHASATTATWTLHTTAAVNVSSSSVLLTAPGGARLRLDALAAAGAPVEWAAALLALPPPQATTYQGAPVYVVTAAVAATAGGLNVTMTPICD